MVSNWPPALQAALARWGATQGKSPALTALDITGKPLYTLTYGEMQKDWKDVNSFKSAAESYLSDRKTNVLCDKATVKDIICHLSFLLHLLSVRETVESQREAGIHPLEQAWHQERTNPQTWRPGKRAVTLPENRLHTTHSVK